MAVTHAVAWFFPAGFLLIGGGMIVLAIKAKRRRARWEAAATRTSGEVTDLRWQSGGQAGDSHLLAFPVLRFSLPDGRTVEAQSSWGTNPPAAKPGAQATVLYDPAERLTAGRRQRFGRQRRDHRDPARLDGAVRAYAEAGGSFSGRPGSGASSSGMSAGGPSG